MKRFVKRLAALLALMLLAAFPGCAATLVGDDLPNAVIPSAYNDLITSRQATALADNDAGTSASWTQYFLRHGEGMVLQITFPDGTDLTDMWLRGGRCDSYQNYYDHARPSVVRLLINYEEDGYTRQATLRYRMEDAYALTGSGWLNGYQQLAFPQTYTEVYSIVFYIESWYSGNASSDPVYLADMMFSGSQQTTGSGGGASQSAGFAGVSAPLLTRMATRSGPSTEYTEPGSFFQAGHVVTVHSISYDRNDVPWVQVEFTYGSSLLRAYTGLKRVDVNASLLPVEAGPLYESSLKYNCQPRRGPGDHYSLEPNVTLRSGSKVTVTGHEDGWVQCEYYSPDAKKMRRIWIPEDYLTYHW